MRSIFHETYEEQLFALTEQRFYVNAELDMRAVAVEFCILGYERLLIAGRTVDRRPDLIMERLRCHGEQIMRCRT
ncbi:hypothetical protein D3C80_1684660 [compost metagenome]